MADPTLGQSDDLAFIAEASQHVQDIYDAYRAGKLSLDRGLVNALSQVREQLAAVRIDGSVTSAATDQRNAACGQIAKMLREAAMDTSPVAPAPPILAPPTAETDTQTTPMTTGPSTTEASYPTPPLWNPPTEPLPVVPAGISTPPPMYSTAPSAGQSPPLWPPPPSAPMQPDWAHNSRFSQTADRATSKKEPTIRGPIWIVTAAVTVLALAAGGLFFILGGHSKGPSTSRVGAPASSTPTPKPHGAQESAPTGTCTQVPASLDSPAGSPSTVAGQTAASVADTVVKYAYQELDPDAIYYRMQNVTPADGAALLPTTIQTLGDQATQVTTATLMTPGGEDGNLGVYRFPAPAQATAFVRSFWAAGCAQQTHVDVFSGAVGAYLTVKSPGVINYSTDVVVAVGAYAVVYGLPGQLPVSTTEPMVTQIVGSLESPNVSPRVDISDAIGPVAG